MAVCGRASVARFATRSVADYNVSPGIAPNFYDASFGISYDVKPAGNTEPLAAAINYYKNHGKALFRFVDDPLVPIDNSPTEREFQNVAKLRFNMLFAGSPEGACAGTRSAAPTRSKLRSESDPHPNWGAWTCSCSWHPQTQT